MNLEHNSYLSQLYETKNILKYLFQIDFSLEKDNITYDASDSVRNWIDLIFKNTISSINLKHFGTGYKGIFMSATEQKTNTTSNNLFLLDFSYNFWFFCFKQNCILKAYHRIRKLISLCQNATSYSVSGLTFNNDFNKFRKTYGLNFCWDNDINLSRSDTEFKVEPSNNLITSRCKESGLITRKANRLFADLSLYNTEIISLYNKKIADSKELIQYNNLEFLQLLGGRKLPDDKSKTKSSTDKPNAKYVNFHNIFKSVTLEHFKQNDYEKYIMDYMTLYNDLKIPIIWGNESTSNSKYCCLSLADKIYCLYLIESIFSISIIDCFYQNWISKENLLLAYSTEILSSLQQLPNVFSRHYILQMAFSCQTQRYNTAFSYFFDVQPSILGTVKIEADYTSTIWMQKYINMTNILSKLLFPIFDNTFFILLWDSMKLNYSDEKKCIFTLYTKLSEYLNDTENIKSLFSITDLIPSIQKKYGFKNITSNNIIEPFNYNFYDVDLSRYHDFIKTSISPREETPDLISLEYLKNIVPYCLDDITNSFFKGIIQ